VPISSTAPSASSRPFTRPSVTTRRGVGPETAVLPRRWAERLIAVHTPATRGATGWCLEPHDLCVAKLVAGRDKDLRFVGAAIKRDIVSLALLRERLALTAIEDERLERVQGWLERQTQAQQRG